jgi:hypothetical protein
MGRWKKSATPRRSNINAMECLDWNTFGLLAAAVFVIFADQNLMAPNLTAVSLLLGGGLSCYLPAPPDPLPPPS